MILDVVSAASFYHVLKDCARLNARVSHEGYCCVQLRVPVPRVLLHSRSGVPGADLHPEVGTTGARPRESPGSIESGPLAHVEDTTQAHPPSLTGGDLTAQGPAPDDAQPTTTVTAAVRSPCSISLEHTGMSSVVSVRMR